MSDKQPELSKQDISMLLAAAEYAIQLEDSHKEFGRKGIDWIQDAINNAKLYLGIKTC